MFRFIAFLRAINVGGGRTVKMQSLRQVFDSLGFSKVATFIASGNVVFETTTKETKAFERTIEKALKTGFIFLVFALCERAVRSRVARAGGGLGRALGETPNGLSTTASLRKFERSVNENDVGHRPTLRYVRISSDSSQLFIRTHVSARPLQDQTHGELVYRPFQF